MTTEVLRLGERRSVRLLEVLGEGGFGVVWRGELSGAAGLVKPVAVKVLNQSAAEVPELASRLRDEARMLALLRHRAIVGVDDLVEVDGRWALVMEYVEGVDLERLIEQGSLPVRPLCEILLEAASALHAAHSARHPATGADLELVHRDIKPANLRITAGGEVKLLDFGIARARFDAREATTRELSFGSVGYMAPERWEGREGPEADVYALGIVGIEALSGRKLGQLPVEAKRHAARLFLAIRGLEGIPEELGELLSVMVDYFPEQRPTAAEVVSRLRGALLVAEGPWLAEWAPDAIAALPARDSVPEDGNTPTFAHEGGDEQVARVSVEPTRFEGAVSPRARVAPEPPGSSAPTRRVARRWLALASVGIVLAAVVLVVGVAGVGGAAWFLSDAGTSAHGEPAPASTPAPSAPAATSPATGATTGAGTPAPPEGRATPAPAPTTKPAPAPKPAPAVKPAPAPRPAPTAKHAPAPAPRHVAPHPAPRTAPPTSSPPAAAPVPAVALGELVLDAAKVKQVLVVDHDGRTHYPGPLPAGTYTARVTFPDGVTIEVDGITVRPAETTTLQCSALAETCVLR